MSDENEVEDNKDELSGKFLVPTPIITAPTASVVSRRFNVHAITSPRPHSKWNLDFFKVGQSGRLKRYDGGPGIAFIEFVVPDELPVGENLYFKIEYRDLLTTIYSPWATSRVFRIIQAPPPLPEIRAPAEGFSHIGAGQLNGTCVAGAKVTAIFINGNPPEADVYVNVTEWAYNYSWAPGRHQFRMKQTLNGEESGLTGIRTFYTKAPQPTINPPPTPAGAKQVLTIAGVWPDAPTLQMFTGANTPVAGTFSASGTTRTFTPTANWAFGTTTVKVVQTVNAVASDPSNLVSVVVKPLAPHITTPKEGESHVAVEVAGTCEPGATVKVWSVGTDLGATEVTGTSWKNRWPWTPGPKVVHARQTVAGQTSDDSTVINFKIKPPKPTISPTPNPAAAKQELSITDVWSGAVTLQMLTEAGTPVAGTFSASGTTRTFTPTANWAFGTTTVKVVQTVNAVASDPSNLVSVVVKPLAPHITTPKEGESHVAVEVTGTCEPGATVKVWSGGTDLGATEVTGTSWINRWPWTPGPKVVHARQTVAGQTSDDSAVINFKIKPPKPTISPTPNPAAAKQELSITDVWSGAVTLQMLIEAGTPVAGTFSASGTTRTFTPTANWAFGTTTVKVVQTVNAVASDPSNLVSVVVKPLAPHITTPKEGESHVAVEVTGTCEPGATVKVWSGGTDLGATEVTGTSWINRWPWTPGPKVVHARQTVAGQTSDDSAVINFKIKPPKPTISPPPRPAAAREVLNITDVWSGAVTLQMLNEAGTTVAGSFSASGTTRSFTPTEDWTPGDNTVTVVQTVNAVDSDPSDGCTFTVEVGEKPEAPQFLLPMAGAKTSTRPVIKVSGLAGALHTVRLEDGGTLHENNADADGVLEFTIQTPLTPGTNRLQVKQKANGPASDWSEPHLFTVKELPKTPIIQVPLDAALVPRTPVIRGKGETRGQILLRHEDDPENLIATISGLTSWRWTAKEMWPLGDYAIQAQQTEDGDSSDWTETRSFTVVDARYGIGDATPVLGNPVVGTGQSVMLRVQVLSGDSGEAAEGVKVEWRIKGEQDVLATTETGRDGWAHYAYTPETAGKSEIVADITNDNAGVVMTELYEVNALLHDDWAREITLYLDGRHVGLAKSDLVLVKGKPSRLQIEVKAGSKLIGSSVTLQDLWGATEHGLTFVPELGTAQVVEKVQALVWSISLEEGQSGIFGLNLTSPVMPDWQLPGHVVTGDFAEFVDVDLDTFPQVFGGEPAYPCLGATHTVNVRPKLNSLLLGLPVTLQLTQEAADLGVTVSPSSPQRMNENGVSWSLDCVNSSKSGNFAVRLNLVGWEFTSPEMPMSLGHNKVEITETFGPQEMGGSASYWRYGKRATSTFTGQPAGGVPVTVTISGTPSQRNTGPDGWIYVNYNDDQSASLTIRNRYDGSSA